MNLAQVKEKTIKLINSYSNSGNLIPATDPNQLDYTLRFNDLIDIAQKEVATIKKIIHKYTIEIAEEGSHTKIYMPDDYSQIQTVISDYRKIPYIQLGRNEIAVRNDISFPVDVFYYAYPETINDMTMDSHELEVDIEAQETIPYYVAAHVLMDETELYATLYNIYQQKLSNFDTRIASGNDVIQTVYHI